MTNEKSVSFYMEQELQKQRKLRILKPKATRNGQKKATIKNE